MLYLKPAQAELQDQASNDSGVFSRVFQNRQLEKPAFTAGQNSKEIVETFAVIHKLSSLR